MYNYSDKMKNIYIYVCIFVIYILSLRMIFLALAMPALASYEELNVLKLLYVLILGIMLFISCTYIYIGKYLYFFTYFTVFLLSIYFITPVFNYSSHDTLLQNYVYSLIIDSLWWVRFLHLLCGVLILLGIKNKGFVTLRQV